MAASEDYGVIWETVKTSMTEFFCENSKSLSREKLHYKSSQSLEYVFDDQKQSFTDVLQNAEAATRDVN